MWATCNGVVLPEDTMAYLQRGRQYIRKVLNISYCSITFYVNFFLNNGRFQLAAQEFREVVSQLIEHYMCTLAGGGKSRNLNI